MVTSSGLSFGGTESGSLDVKLCRPTLNRLSSVVWLIWKLYEFTL